MGLLIQPIVGATSDKTWNKFDLRNPYIMIGAIFATIWMLLMSNAPLFFSIITPMLLGAMMLAVMNASFNIAFQPFRALMSVITLSNTQKVYPASKKMIWSLKL